LILRASWAIIVLMSIVRTGFASLLTGLLLREAGEGARVR
jgi:hypothetical protein